MIQDARKIVGESEYIPTDPQELSGRIFTTCYMASSNSSKATNDSAKLLAKQLGRYGSFVHKLRHITFLACLVPLAINSQELLFTISSCDSLKTPGISIYEDEESKVS